VAEAVYLEQGGRTLLARTYLKNGKVVILEPTEPLDFGMSYKVVVKPTLLGSSGSFLTDGETWSFFTEGKSLPSVSSDSMRAHLEILAHDSLKGRGSGSEDELRAAHFLKGLFESYGLEAPPGGTLQSFSTYVEALDTLMTSQNVLAVVPGSGRLADEWLVVGAHYDHLGQRTHLDGSVSVNNGADDNGSGTVLLLEMARIFQEYVAGGSMPVDHRRSVLFAAFGAEEVGLVGSCYYASQQPAVPVAQTRALLNFDMVGRLRDEVLQVIGYGTSVDWAPMVSNSNRPQLQIFDRPFAPDGLTDHFCFWQQGVPYLWFYTGHHDEYHSPADDVDLINFPGLADIGELGLRTLIRLAVEEDPLK
jgi:hypothetical protein